MNRRAYPLLHPFVLLWLALLLLCGFLINRTSFVADMSAFLPRKPSPEQALLVGQLRDGIASRFILVGIEGSQAPVLAQLSKATAKELRNQPAFAAVHNGETSGFENDQSFVFKHRYLLSPTVTAERFTVTGLHQALEESIAEIASSTGLFTKELLTSDPTGEVMQLVNQLIPSNAPNTTQGVWMSKDSTRASLLIQTSASGSDLDAQEEALSAIRQAFEVAKKTIDPNAGQQVRLLMSGPSIFAVDSREIIKRESTRLSILGTVLVMSLLFVVYRSLRTLVLGIIPVLTGALAGIAAVALVFGNVHGLTLGFGVTLIGEAVDYAIYLFMQYKSRATDSVDNSLTPAFSKHFWPTIRLGVLTSVCGFSALLFSGFSGLAQLGLFSISGVVSAALVARFVLPQLIAKDFQVRTSRLGARLAAMVEALERQRVPALSLALIATLILALHHKDLWNQELGGLSTVSADAQAMDAKLRSDIAAPDARYLIIVKAPSNETALQATEQVSRALDALSQANVIGSYEAASRYLPSQRTQAARLAILPDNVTLTGRLREALVGLPTQADRFTPFIKDINEAKQTQLLSIESLKGTSLATAVNALLVQDADKDRAWTSLIPLRAPTKDDEALDIDATRVKQAIASTPNAVLLDIKGEANAMYQSYLHEAIVLTLAGFAAILVLLSMSLRSVARVWRVCAPLLLAVLFVTAGFALLGIKMNLLHLVGMLLVIAVGSNYSLFFDQRRLDLAQSESKTDNATLEAMFVANLSTMIGFGLLAFSQVPVLKAIGMTVGPGAFLALILSAVLTGQSMKIPPSS